MQNNKSGHIKHEDIDMDPHDRAVRRSAGRRSRGQNRSRSSGAPLWLICILIFIGVVGFFLIRLSSKMKSAENAEVDLSTPEPQATEELVPEAAPGSDPEVLSDRGGLLIVGGRGSGQRRHSAHPGACPHADAHAKRPCPQLREGRLLRVRRKAGVPDRMAAGRILSGDGTRRNRDRGGIRHEGFRRL